MKFPTSAKLLLLLLSVFEVLYLSLWIYPYFDFGLRDITRETWMFDVAVISTLTIFTICSFVYFLLAWKFMSGTTKRQMKGKVLLLILCLAHLIVTGYFLLIDLNIFSDLESMDELNLFNKLNVITSIVLSLLYIWVIFEAARIYSLVKKHEQFVGQIKS